MKLGENMSDNNDDINKELNNDKDDKKVDHICYLCHRPESVTGNMIDIQVV